MDPSRRRTIQSQGHAFFDGPDYKPSTAEQLRQRFELKEDEQAELIEALYELETQGIAVHVPGRGWCSPSREGWLVGTLSVNRRGFAFVRPARDDGRGDIFIAPRKFKDAHDGDLVLVKVAKPRRRGTASAAGPGGRTKRGPRRRDRAAGSAASRAGEAREGRLLTVLRRSPRVVMGVYYRGERADGIVEPLDNQSLREIFIPGGKEKQAKDGARVLARLVEGPTVGGLPPGEVVDVLAAEGSWRADLQVILAEYALTPDFPAEVLADAERFPKRIPAAELEGRADLRELPIITIDPADAKDFDDAVTLERRPDGGWRVGVFIADVSYYVRAGSPLDREAYRRGTSVYLPGCVIPMLPERLSNGLCSLVPGEDRLVRAVWLDITGAGVLAGSTLEGAVIHNARRYTYEEVQAILDGAAPARGEKELAAMLRQMDELRGLLREARLARGALELDLDEQELVLDSKGEVLDVRARRRDRAHNLIEELMLLANEAVARTATARKIPILRREHAAPAEDDVETFLKFCRVVVPGIRVTGDKDFQKLVDAVRGRPVAPIVNTVLLRSLARAQYSAAKSRHFALASDEYCHFTSPIRRYPDLQVHQALFAGVRTGSRSRAGAEDGDSQLEHMADHCSATERSADEAEREMNQLRAISWLARREGERFIGVITSALDYGFFVRLDGSMVEGMVHVSTLDGDFYQLLESHFALRGRNRGHTFRIGDVVEVQLERADPVARQVDFSYVMHRSR